MTVMARNSQYTLLVLMIFSVYGKVRGLAFVTEPNNTVVAFTGFNQTFTWTLNLTEEDKSKELKVVFGPWNKKYSYVNNYLMTFVREPSGKENEEKKNHTIAKRLYWTGDLSRDNYIAFQLVNIKRDDSGDYGIRVRADYFPPEILEGWFTLSVQDPPVKPTVGFDGEWSNWNAWGSCSVTCGGGLQTRHRTCTNPPPRPHLLYCQGSRLQARLCNTNNCLIHGGWSDWNEWSLCTKAIGGIQIRTRECVNPNPRYGGEPCSGNRVFARECGNTSSCHEAFPVRFRTEDIPSLGTMEIFKNKTWEKLCTASWDDAEENLTCRAMGYFNNGSNNNSTGQDGRNGSNTTVHHSCRSMTHDCVKNSKDDLQKCKVPVRLNGANIEYGGRVEVFYRGKWGKICRKKWDLNDVKVVCNQLGFKGALAEFIASEVKEENIPYLMSKVSCNGHEPDLASCRRTDGDYDCPDDKGAQALCEPKNREALEKKTFISDIGSIETFHCSLPNDTSMTKWYVKGEDASLFAGGRIKASGGTLIINNVQLSDGGTYECRGLKYARFYTIYVNAIFKDTPIRQTLISGTSGILKCSAVGTPTPQFDKWIKDGNKILDEGRFKQMSNGNLRIYPVWPEDQGTYTCAMKQNRNKRIITKYRNIHVSVVGNPQVSVTPTNQTVTEGKATNISCKVTAGVPKPTLSWSFKDKSLPPVIVVTETEDGSVIHVKGTTKSMEGTYMCTARNRAGAANATSILRVLEKPTAEISRESYSPFLVGDKLTLICKVSGERVEVKWKKNGSPVTPRARISQDGDKSTLVIENVEGGDGGDYSCEAHNDAGFTTSTVVIDVRSRMTFGHSLSGGLFLECTNNGMIVTLDHRSIANADLDKVTLNDSYCELSKYGSSNSTHLSMNVPLDSCMTKHSTEGDTITYENILIITTREYTGAAKISREFKASFPFKCSYPRSAVVSVASFSPRQKVIHIKTAEYGNLTIAMDLYETGEYDTPYVGYPVAFDLNEKMYVEVKITSDEDQLVIIPLKCWGTPDPDKADGMSYAFIDKGCKKDDTLVYNYKESAVQRFTLDAFRFLGESADAEIYLRCSVEACLKDDSESRCAKGCEENSSRKRRDLSLDALAEQIVTIGPMSRRKQSSETVHEQRKSKSSLSVFAVVAGVLAVAVLALTVALVMLYKRYSSPQNAPLVVYSKASSEDRV